VTPDLPGHGQRAVEHRQASVGAYAGAVVEAMDAAGVGRAVVVGHSMGGIVIPKVAETAPERVAHLVFLASVVVPDGQSLFDTHFPPAAQARMRALAEASGDGTCRYPPDEAWARWMNDLPREDPVVEAALARLTPQPLAPLTERLDLRRFYRMAVPRTYVRCLRDAAVPPDLALAYARRLGVTPVDLDAGHDVMLSAPDALAELLLGLGL
jgi:pimeloyl-ACP methyl ester carboxylesterase